MASSEMLGDETVVEDRARELRRAAETSQQSGAVLERTLTNAKWSGPMRDRYVGISEFQRTELSDAADQLVDVASRLDQHAQWIRDEKARLAGLASRIDAWAAENPAGSSVEGLDASQLANRPAPNSFAWDDVAERLRTLGIVF